MYDGLNVGKRNVTLNLKQPEAVELVQRLVVEWADAVAENFAPRAMKGFGLDYDTLAAIKPDLVMVSACLNGQTGPHKDYPGFGGQGSALAGLQRAHRLARPRARRPVRHDHRLARAPLRRDRARGRSALPPRAPAAACTSTSRRSSAASWSLAPWLLDYEVDGVIRLRDGNNHRDARLHGVFPCADEDGVARPLGRDRVLDRRRARTAARRSRAAPTSTAWTATRTRVDVADAAAGGRHRGRAGPGLRRPARRPAARAPRHFERTRTRSSATASTSATASASPRAERLRPRRPDARPGQRLGPRRAPRPRRRRDRGIARPGRGGVS